MNSRSRESQLSKLHPIWTAVGCGLLVLIPAISWGLADRLLALALEEFPELARNYGGAEINILVIKISSTVILTVLLFLLFGLIGSLLYWLFGGSKNAEIASRIGWRRRR
ncbi:MAG: hypothetical protein WD740_06685 [Anaerolineales bacterium]